MNKTAEINRLALWIQSDAEEIVYHTSSGYMSPERILKIRSYLTDLENNIEELREIVGKDG